MPGVKAKPRKKRKANYFHGLKNLANEVHCALKKYFQPVRWAGFFVYIKIPAGYACRAGVLDQVRKTVPLAPGIPSACKNPGVDHCRYYAHPFVGCQTFTEIYRNMPHGAFAVSANDLQNAAGGAVFVRGEIREKRDDFAGQKFPGAAVDPEIVPIPYTGSDAGDIGNILQDVQRDIFAGGQAAVDLFDQFRGAALGGVVFRIGKFPLRHGISAVSPDGRQDFGRDPFPEFPRRRLVAPNDQSIQVGFRNDVELLRAVSRPTVTKS